MKQEIKQLFGNRVALQLVEEEYKGLLTLPPTTERMHVLSKVVAKGDKVVQNISVNDILFWQTNAMIQKHCRFDLNGVATFVLLTGDMIARLTSNVVDRDNFHVIGDFCLLRRVVVQPSKLIILPSEVIEANQETTVKFILEEKGETVDTPAEVGQEVLVDRTRANPITLGKDSYYYIHKNFILGIVG
jgi:hypothetical protein